MAIKIKDKPSIYFNAKEVERVQAYVDTLSEDSGVTNVAKLIIHLLDTHVIGEPTEAPPVSDTEEYIKLKGMYDTIHGANEKLIDDNKQLRADLAKAKGQKPAPEKPATKPTEKPVKKEPETKKEETETAAHWMFGE